MFFKNFANKFRSASIRSRRSKIVGTGMLFGTITGLFVNKEGQPVEAPSSLDVLAKYLSVEDKYIKVDKESLPTLPEFPGETNKFIFPPRPVVTDFQTEFEYKEQIKNTKDPFTQSYYDHMNADPEKRGKLFRASQDPRTPVSHHPFFPKDRRLIDAFLKIAYSDYWNSIPKILPGAVPPPYGKRFTIFIDTSVLITGDGKKRNHTDPFLATLARTGEIILYGRSLEEISIVDERMRWGTYYLVPALNDRLPPIFFKHPKILNRSFFNFIMIDTRAEECLFAPKNSLIIDRAPRQDVDDDQLMYLLNIVDGIQLAYLENNTPIYNFISIYHSVKRDCIGEWERLQTLAFYGMI